MVPGAALGSITRGPRGFIKAAAYLRIECSGGLAPAGAREAHPPDQVEVETAAGDKSHANEALGSTWH